MAPQGGGPARILWDGSPLQLPLHGCTPPHTPAPGREELCQTHAFWVSPQGPCTKTKPSTTDGGKKTKQKNKKIPKPHTAAGAGVPPAPSQSPEAPAATAAARASVCRVHPRVPRREQPLRHRAPSHSPAPRRPSPLSLSPAGAESWRSPACRRCLTADLCRGRRQPHRHRYPLPLRSQQEVAASGASRGRR